MVVAIKETLGIVRNTRTKYSVTMFTTETGERLQIKVKNIHVQWKLVAYYSVATAVVVHAFVTLILLMGIQGN